MRSWQTWALPEFIRNRIVDKCFGCSLPYVNPGIVGKPHIHFDRAYIIPEGESFSIPLPEWVKQLDSRYCSSCLKDSMEAPGIGDS